MPKIKFDKESKGPAVSTRTERRGFRDGIRSEPLPRAKDENDECFDMYRIDLPMERKMPRRRSGDRKRVVRKDHQLWYAACLISALGAFCIFVDSVRLMTLESMVSMTSLEILMGSASVKGLPSAMIVTAAMPIVYLCMSVLFAVLKERSFDRPALALLSLTIAAIVIQVYSMRKIADFKMGPLCYLAPGTAGMIEIGCSIALMIVIGYDMVRKGLSNRKERW